MVQEYTSERTCVKQIPALFKWVDWNTNTINGDIGGGKYDVGTNYLKQKGVDNYIYDPYNRSKEHNDTVINTIMGKCDTVTICNVLNVIKEREIRINVLRQAKEMVKENGTVYISIYEGDKSNNPKATIKGWQNNRKTVDYLDEVNEVFNNTKGTKNYIIANEKGIL